MPQTSHAKLVFPLKRNFSDMRKRIGEGLLQLEDVLQERNVLLRNVSIDFKFLQGSDFFCYYVEFDAVAIFGNIDLNPIMKEAIKMLDNAIITE